MSQSSATVKITPYQSKKVFCIVRATIGDSAFQAADFLSVDTEAAFTVFPASLFRGLTEQKLIDSKCETKHGLGISDFKHEGNSKGILCYKLQLSGLSVAGMDFGSVPVYVTFEEGFSFKLLGRDLFDLLDYSVNNTKGIMTMKKTDRFEKFQRKGIPLTNPELLLLGEEPDDLDKSGE